MNKNKEAYDMICNKCGAEYPDTETKCPQCEAETAKVEEVAETVQEVSEVEEMSIEETAVEEVEEFAEFMPVKKSRKGLWIIIAAAVAILAVAAAAFGISSNLYYTSANDENASVYVITKKEMDRVYAKVGTKVYLYSKYINLIYGGKLNGRKYTSIK